VKSSKNKSLIIRLLLLSILFIVFTTYVTAAFHKGSVYGSYSENTLTISGDGILQSKKFTVKELEEMKDGKIEAKYTMQTLVEPHHGKYTGIALDYILKEKVSLKSTAKQVKIISSDGASVAFSLEEVRKKDYINSIDNSKLQILLAYAKEGYPLVPEREDEGYEMKAGNDGGPLRLIVGQTVKGERNSPKCLKYVTEVVVSTTGVKPAFSDIGQFYSWAREAIEYLTEKEIISGISPEKFAPEQNLTRAQFATMLTKALNLKASNSFAGTFKDVSRSDWYATYVELAARQGLVSGYPEGTFKPNQIVNRQEMVVMVIKAIGMEEEAKRKTGRGISYRDNDKIPSWAIGSVEIAEEKGLMDNISVGLFNGTKVVSRADAAVVIYRMLQGKK
jgi:hypothetical protein